MPLPTPLPGNPQSDIESYCEQLSSDHKRIRACAAVSLLLLLPEMNKQQVQMTLEAVSIARALETNKDVEAIMTNLYVRIRVAHIITGS